MKKLTAVFIAFILASPAIAQDIRAGQVKPGTFQSGEYDFPGVVQAGQMGVTNNTPTTGGPYDAVGVTMNVFQPGVFGYSPILSWCNIMVPGGICYGLSVTAKDATDGSGYTHTVALNPQVQQPNAPGSGRDVFGVAVSMGLHSGLHPGAGFRVESSDTLTDGEVTTGYDMTEGVTPTVLQARSGCRLTTCNSAEIKLHGRNLGVANADSEIFQDFLGNTRILSPGYVLLASTNPATSSINYSSPALLFTAHAWNGTGSQEYSWTVFHNINGSGALTASNLQIQPPAGVTNARVAIDAQISPDIGIYADSPGMKHIRLTGGYVNCNASGLGGFCANAAYSWPTAFPDNSYTLACTVTATTAGGVTVGVQSKSASGFTVVSYGNVNTATNTASEVGCIAVHD